MKRILFIEAGAGFKNPNKKLVPLLQGHFPDFDIQVFDVIKVAHGSQVERAYRITSACRSGPEHRRSPCVRDGNAPSGQRRLCRYVH